jgi:hypothetical protein
MSTETKNVFDVVLGSVTLLVALVGGAWAYFRFKKEGAHNPRIELDLDCAFLGPQHGNYVAAFSIYADNKGQVEHRFKEIRLRVRGIRRKQALVEWDERKPMLLFPDSIVSKANVVPPDYGYFFVRPSVRQRISYVTPISEEYAFILARLTFRYGKSEEIHTAERVFEVPEVRKATGG